jgi:hypothetical protein
VYGFFLIGAPEESWDTLRRTIAFARDLGCECTTTTMTPFPGTPLYWRAIRENLLPKEMVYNNWGSYTATVRSYHLTLRDLQAARLWVRLETIIPYRLAQARKEGMRRVLRTHFDHLPHYVVRQGLRAYVWWRSKMVPVLAGARRGDVRSAVDSTSQTSSSACGHGNA